MAETLEALLQEGRTFPPPKTFSAEAHITDASVYDEAERKQRIAFYSSADLKKWRYESRIEGYFECPDLFELPIEGEKKTKWVLYAADGLYALGDFDGKKFMPEPKTKLLAAKLKELGAEDALIVTRERNRNLELAGRNLPHVRVLPVIGVNVRDVLLRKHLVLVGDAVEALTERLS